MRNLILLFCLLFTLSLPAAQPTIITANVTVTNVAGTVNGNTIQVNGVLRLWTNSVTAGATMIQATNTITLATSNLFRAYAQFPQSSMTIYQPTVSNILFKSFIDAPMTVAVSASWATVSYSTNTIGTNAFDVRVPAEVEGLYQRTNIASGLAHWLNISPNTNALDQRAIIASQLMGLANTQTVSGAKSLTNLDNSFYGHFYGLAAGGAPDPGLVWWGTNGNSGLSSAANFLGTVDLCDLIFKANNQKYGEITTNGRVKLGTNDALTIQVSGTNGSGKHLPSLIVNQSALNSRSNWIDQAVGGAVILSGEGNKIYSNSWDTIILGGNDNVVTNSGAFGSPYSLVWGDGNYVGIGSDVGSVALGHKGYMTNAGAFLWNAYGDNTTRGSKGNDTYSIYAPMGAYFETTNGFFLNGVLQLATNKPSIWPLAASTIGGIALVNSNSYGIYELNSSPNSTAWTSTNLISSSGGGGGGGGGTTYTGSTNCGTMTISAGATYLGQISIPGTTVGDVVSLGIDANYPNLLAVFYGYVKDANTVSLMVYNTTGSNLSFVSVVEIKALVTHF